MSKMKLVVFLPAFGMRSASPFCVKADGLLAMSGLPYEVKIGDVRKSETGKLPVLVDGNQTIADSRLIQRHLKRQHGFDPDAHLDPQQKAIALVTQRTIEEHIYFAGVQERWMDNADLVRETYFASVPGLMRKTVFGVVRKTVEKSLHGQGYGRLPRADALRLTERDIAAVAELFQGPYFFGDEPSSIDVVVYAFLGSFSVEECAGPIASVIGQHPKLTEFLGRYGEELFAHAPPVG